MKAKNYRYKKKCKFCGQFNQSGHKCKRKRWKSNKYRCGVCKKYFSKKYFPKDRTKRYGIMCLCKKCRAKRGNGNGQHTTKKFSSTASKDKTTQQTTHTFELSGEHLTFLRFNTHLSNKEMVKEFNKRFNANESIFNLKRVMKEKGILY